MNHRTRWLALGVAAALMVAVLGAPGISAQPIGPTVGEFVTNLVNQGFFGGMTTEEGLKYMKRLGLGKVVSDPNAPLTEAGLAKIMQAFGFRANTQNPGALVDFGMASGALSLLSTSIFNGGWGGLGDGNRPHDVEICLSERNMGQCMSCCVRVKSPNQGCYLYCSALVPSPSTFR